MKRKFFIQKTCNFCHSDLTRWKAVFPLNEEQNLMQCERCSLIFNDKCRIDFENIYGMGYFNPTKKQKKEDVGGYYDYKNMRAKVKKEYYFAIEFINNYIRKQIHRKVRVLDVGSGYGYFLEYFKHTSAFLSALEVSDVCIQYMKKEMPFLDTIKGDFLSLDVKNKYDIICMFEFIEHVIDPMAVLEKAYRLLHKDGFLIITTPNIGSPLFQILKRNWPAIHPQHHNHYFSKVTLSKYLRTIGFRTNRLTEENILYFSFFHIRNRLISVFPWMAIVLNIFSFLDGRLLPIFSGGSMNVIAKK